MGIGIVSRWRRGFRQRDVLACVGFLSLILLITTRMLGLFTPKQGMQPKSSGRIEAPGMPVHGRIFVQPLDVEALDKFARRKKLLEETLALTKQENNRRRKRFPDVIGIGAEKCGTDAVISFLDHHPLIRLPINGSETHYYDLNKAKGSGFYLSLMPEVTKHEVVMEKTPSYFHWSGNIAMEMKMLSKPPKLILILCDPAKRVYSDFVHEVIIAKAAKKKEFPTNVTFHEFVSNYLPEMKKKLSWWKSKKWDIFKIHRRMQDLHLEDKAWHVFSVGLYYYYLSWWTRLFSKKELLILSGEEMMTSPGSVIERVQDFIGIPKLILREDFILNPATGFYCYLSPGKRKSSITEKDMNCLANTKGRTRNKNTSELEDDLNTLKEFYRPFNEVLFKHLGRNLNW